MKVTALVENTRVGGGPDVCAEWGLSLHIEHQDLRLIFDSGASEAFSRNAAKLGIDLSQVDMAVLSHHHADHGGGLCRFLEINTRAKVFLSRKVPGLCSMRALGIGLRSVGLDRGLFRKHLDRLEFVDGYTSIAPDVHLLDDFGLEFARPKANRRLYVKQGGKWVQDSFDHELALLVKRPDGLVVFTGCSHRGIANIIHAVCQAFEGVPIRAVFGGLHLVGIPVLNTMAESRADVERLGETLLKYPIDRIFTGHCTGTRGFRILKETLGDRLMLFAAGDCVEL
jgi:7,8-dihydropterin-6-yl-methyl-4-(beta-D-ribofuranosyl)aminobenzene 5'-phosphate synthase